MFVCISFKFLSYKIVLSSVSVETAQVWVIQVELFLTVQVEILSCFVLQEATNRARKTIIIIFFIFFKLFFKFDFLFCRNIFSFENFQ